MRKYFGLALVLVTCGMIAGCGQVNHGTGTVLGEDGRPVGAAKVQFWCGGSATARDTVFTDNDGHFDFRVESDRGRTQTGDLVVGKDGYEGTGLTYHAAPAAAPVTIVLKRASSGG